MAHQPLTRIHIAEVLIKMGENRVLHRIRRHLSLGNQLPSVFAKWNKSSGKITLVSEKKEKIVLAFTILQFVVILAKAWSITARTTNLKENILGIAILTWSITTFLLRCHISSDYVQVQFLNYILLSKGYISKICIYEYIFILYNFP